MAWIPVHTTGTKEKNSKPTADDFFRKWGRIVNDPYLARLYTPLMLQEATSLEGKISRAEALKLESFIGEVTAMSQAAQQAPEPDEESNFLAWPYG